MFFFSPGKKCQCREIKLLSQKMSVHVFSLFHFSALRKSFEFLEKFPHKIQEQKQKITNDYVRNLSFNRLAQLKVTHSRFFFFFSVLRSIRFTTEPFCMDNLANIYLIRFQKNVCLPFQNLNK